MKKPYFIAICSAVFAIIGLVAGFVVIANMPENASGWNKVDLMMMVAFGPPLVGAFLGFGVGFFASTVWPNADAPGEADGGRQAITQPYARR